MIQQLLEIKGLRAYYRTLVGVVRAVDGVSLTIKRGEIFGIAGESGCGKSTLAKATLRLLKSPGYIHEGSILFEGRDLMSLNEENLRKLRWSQIAYIPQSSMNSLNPVMRIENQIMDAILAHENWSKDKARERALQLIRMVGLPERVLRMYPHELSGGMKQRCVIATAIALSPKLIVADEPTTALDVVIQRGILQALREIKETLHASIMLITHDMAVHAEIVDRLMVMYAGKVVELGDIHHIFKDPLHPYVKMLISAIPTIEERREIKGMPGRPPSLLNPPSGCRFYPRCPYAMKKCSQEEPKLKEVSPGHFVACHLYEGW